MKLLPKLTMMALFLFPSLAEAQGIVTIAASQTPANITLDRHANYVVIRENAATPTTPFSITPTGAGTALVYPAGAQYVFSAPASTAGPTRFTSGGTIGTLSIPSGNASFVAIESFDPPLLMGGQSGGYSGTIPSGSDPNAGIHNFSNSSLTPGGNAGTYYYIAPSALTMPATYKTAIGPGTTMNWRIAMSKTAAGTGAFNIRLYYGTNGTISDSTIATQSVGTATAALDDMVADVELTFTSVSAAYWSISCLHSAATATGFGCAIGSQQFSGTVTGLTTTTGSLIFGVGYSNTTGTAVITIPLVQSTAFGVN